MQEMNYYTRRNLISYLNGFFTSGGTNINDALLYAARMSPGTVVKNTPYLVSVYQIFSTHPYIIYGICPESGLQIRQFFD